MQHCCCLQEHVECEIKDTSRFTSCQPIHITSVSTAANDHASQALKQSCLLKNKYWAYTHPWVLGSPSCLSHFQGNDTVDNFLIQRGDSAYAAGVWLASAEKLQSISYREVGSDYVFTQGKQVLLWATTHSGVVHYASHRHIIYRHVFVTVMRRLHDDASYEYGDFSIRFHWRGAAFTRSHFVILSAKVDYAHGIWACHLGKHSKFNTMLRCEKCNLVSIDVEVAVLLSTFLASMKAKVRLYQEYVFIFLYLHMKSCIFQVCCFRSIHLSYRIQKLLDLLGIHIEFHWIRVNKHPIR